MNSPRRLPPGEPRKVWVTGAGGLIGRAVVDSPGRPPAWIAVGLGRGGLELTDPRAVAEQFRQDRPDALVHCAAVSKSPACQADPDRARRVNVEATAALADLFDGRPMVFLSTDLVFDGARGGYVETDPVNPLSVYAETKVAAEARLAGRPGVLILRTSLNHGVSPTGDRGFNEETVAAWRAGRTLRFFTDEYRCPLPASVTARVIWALLAQGASGLFHVGGAERLSRWEIGLRLAARHPGLHPRLEPASLREYLGAPRAPDTSLDSARVQARLDFPLPRYTDWLNQEAAGPAHA